MSQALVDQLAATPLCAPLAWEEVERIASAGRVERWSADAEVMEEGTEGPRLVVLLEGEVEILKRDEHGAAHRIERLGPGEVLGEMSLLTGAPRAATVRSLSALRVFALDRHTFEEMVQDRDPAALHLGLCMARALAERVASLNQRVVALLESEAQLIASPGVGALHQGVVRLSS
jgi:CRP-like cAMP-binding protein